MPTRRQVLEAALAMERDALWADFDDEDRFSPRAADIVRRIRLVSEALGYPTAHETLPIHLWRVYAWVETCVSLGIRADDIAWDLIEDHWDRCPDLSSDEKELYAWNAR